MILLAQTQLMRISSVLQRFRAVMMGLMRRQGGAESGAQLASKVNTTGLSLKFNGVAPKREMTVTLKV